MKSVPFKEGLDEWKKTQESIELARLIINPPKKEPHFIPLEKRKTSRPAERVIHGEVAWKPINKQAALLLSKAPWWAHSVPEIDEIRKKDLVEEPKPKSKKIRKHKTMSDMNPVELTSIPFQPQGDVRTESVGGHLLININDIVVKVIAEINRQPQQLTNFARAAIDARNVADENTKALGGLMEDFNAKVKVSLEAIRQTRYAIVTEVSQMTTPLKEVRQFFLGADYKEQIERLTNFVDLCERLQKLKESGMLDAIGDTMIKLEYGQAK